MPHHTFPFACYQRHARNPSALDKTNLSGSTASAGGRSTDFHTCFRRSRLTISLKLCPFILCEAAHGTGAKNILENQSVIIRIHPKELSGGVPPPTRHETRQQRNQVETLRRCGVAICGRCPQMRRWVPKRITLTPAQPYLSKNGDASFATSWLRRTHGKLRNSPHAKATTSRPSRKVKLMEPIASHRWRVHIRPTPSRRSALSLCHET